MLGPLINYLPNLIRRTKPVLVLTFDTRFCIKIIDSLVLAGPSSLDKNNPHPACTAQKNNRLTAELDRVVSSSQQRAVSLLTELGQIAARLITYKGVDSDQPDHRPFDRLIDADEPNIKRQASYR